MTEKPSFSPNLPVKRENHVLAHTYRMGITMPEVLHRMFFPGKSKNAVTQAVRRLLRHGYLNKHPLTSKRVYYTLGQRCVRLMNAPRSKTIVRGEQVLPIDLAALAFCCLQEPVRRKLLPEELLKEFPWFPKQFLCHPFCLINEAGQKNLAIIKVELTDFPQQVLRKHQKQLHAFRQCAAFNELIDQQRFVVVTVTTTPERRQLLEQVFESDPWYPPFCVFDYPLLCELL